MLQQECEIAFDKHSEVLLHRTVEQLAFVIYLIMETFLYQYVQISLSLINHKIFFFSVNIPNLNWYLTSNYRNTSLEKVNSLEYSVIYPSLYSCSGLYCSSQINKNKSITYNNLQDATKAAFREKCIAINVHVK